MSKIQYPKKGFHPLKSIEAELPMDHIGIDLAGPLPTTEDGYNYVLVVIDVCTKFTFLRALKSKLATEIAQSLFELFCDVGFPKIIQSDNGREFVNEIMDELCSQGGVDLRLISPYHPRANGITERAVQ